MVGIRNIEAALAYMNGGDATGLRTRLQYLSIQGFPPGLRVGAARRVDYELDEALAFTLWFSLTQAGFSPLIATALVTDFWPELARLFLEADEASNKKPDETLPSSETMAIIVGNALKASGRLNPGDLASIAKPFDLVTSKRSDLANNLNGGLAANVVIDMSAIRARLFEALTSAPDLIAQAILTSQTTSLATREGRAPNSADSRFNDLRVQVKVVPKRGERLGERDYYFARALELLSTSDGVPGTHSITLRQQRLARYIIEPSPRESWKRWVEVGDTKTPFIWGMTAFITEAGILPGLSLTIADGSADRLAQISRSSLEAKLRSTAEQAKAYTPVRAESLITQG